MERVGEGERERGREGGRERGNSDRMRQREWESGDKEEEGDRGIEIDRE